MKESNLQYLNMLDDLYIKAYTGRTLTQIAPHASPEFLQRLSVMSAMHPWDFGTVTTRTTHWVFLSRTEDSLVFRKEVVFKGVTLNGVNIKMGLDYAQEWTLTRDGIILKVEFERST